MIVLSIIILSYNTRELTANCVTSILNQYKKQIEGKEFEIIVLDNGSGDDSVSYLEKQFKDTISLIKSKENLGFSKGINAASKQAKGNLLFFLNSDTKMLDAGLTKMVQYYKAHGFTGVLGARLLDSESSVERSAGSFFHLPAVIGMLFGLERFGFIRKSPKKMQTVDWVSGGAMMVPKKTFEELSGFDEHYFMYMEDMDFCYRGSKKGITTKYFPEIAIFHQEHGSSKRAFAIKEIYKGLLYFYKKHKPDREYFIVCSLFKTKAKVLSIYGVVTGNNYFKETYSINFR